MKEVIKNHKGKIAAGTGVSGVLIALFMNFGTISNELQEWFYMAKGESVKPSSIEKVSEDKFADKSDYVIINSTGKKTNPGTKNNIKVK